MTPHASAPSTQSADLMGEGISTVPATEARKNWKRILDNADNGRFTVIIRHSRPVAVIGPALYLTIKDIIARIKREQA